MSKGGGSAERNMEIQHEMDINKWEYNRNRQLENFDYMTDGYAIAEIGSRIYHVRVRCDAIVRARSPDSAKSIRIASLPSSVSHWSW